MATTKWVERALVLIAGCGRIGFGGAGDGGNVDAVDARTQVIEPVMLFEVGARLDSPTLASDGTSLAVSWLDDRAALGSPPDLYFQLFALDGQPLFNARLTAGGQAGPPKLLWTGTQYALLYTGVPASREQVVLINIAQDGTLLGGGMTLTPSNADSHFRDAVWHGNRLSIVYDDVQGGSRFVRHLHATLAGVVSDDAQLSVSLPSATYARVAAAGSGREAAIWIESTTLHYSLIAPTPVNDVIIAGPVSGVASPPAMVSTGTQQLVVFDSDGGGDIAAFVVDQTTGDVTSFARPVPSVRLYPQLEAIGTTVAVFAASGTFQLLDAVGAQADAPVTIEPDGCNDPVMTLVGTAELGLAWVAQPVPSIVSRQLWFARVRP